MPVSKILLTSLLAVVLSPAPRAAGAFPPPAPPFSDSLSSKFNPGHRHIILIVWDGLRPDFVTEHNAPALCQLARNGVTFARHHSVYLSATEVNGTALSTGAYPAHNDIIGNNEYRPRIDPLSWVHTELPEVVHRGDELTHGHYLRRATIAQIVRQAGGKTAVAGAKPVTLLADRAPRSSDTTDGNVFGGSTLPPNLLAIITNHYGRFPDGAATESTRNDWTTDAMIDPLWANGVPEFSLLWMNEPDFDQHQTGPGSRQALAGIRNADENLAKVLRVLEAKGVRDSTDIIVVSDHGCSTVSSRVDLADSLQKAGLNAVREFKAKPARGDILVVSNSGSTLLYVIGHEQKVIRSLIRFLQSWEFTGVIFTRKPMPGTFSLGQIHLDTEAAPDVLVSMRWSSDKNTNGTPGMLASDLSSFNPGQGLHVSLSPFDMHATLVAAGPDFLSGVVTALPSGNLDIAPTVLWLLGLKPPKPMDGRVLTEALSIKGPKINVSRSHHLEATHSQDGSVWHQYLNLTKLNGVLYLDEGNGSLQKTY